MEEGSKSREAPTNASKRALQVQSDLEPTQSVCASTFLTCVCCAVQVAAAKELPVCCKDCRLSIYCSNDCREQDRAFHKRDGYCQESKNLRDQHRRAWNDFISNGADARNEWYRKRFGDAYNGHNRYELMKGCFSEDPYYKPVSDAQNELALKLARHPILPQAVEESLIQLLDMKQATYLADSYNMDASIVSVLLKLYREDDAVSFILYWLDWRSRGQDINDLRDHVIVKWKYRSSASAAQWPFSITKDARFDDIAECFRNFPTQQVGASVPIELALVALVIKMRFITVYRKRAEAETLYLHFNEGGLGLKMLGSDHRAHILSFLVEGGRGRYLIQLDQVNSLFDYIDERDPTLLRALVDPRVRRGKNKLCFKTYLKDYANGKPVKHSIKCMLIERYFLDAPTAASPNNKRTGATDSSKNNSSRKLARHGELSSLDNN